MAYAYEVNHSTVTLLSIYHIVGFGTFQVRGLIILTSNVADAALNNVIITRGDYWKAQCIFRGLSSNSTTKILQGRIREKTYPYKKMDPVIAALEAGVKKAYIDYKNENWKILSPEMRIKENPTRYLKELPKPWS